MLENGRRKLQSWKQIAAYLGREVRTVVRWEKERGLPVHRLPGGKGSTVFAYADELDAWTAGNTPQAGPAAAAVPVRRRFWRWAAGAVVGVAAAGGLLARWAMFGLGPLERVLVDGQALVAVDSRGREMWRHTGPAPLGRPFNRASQLMDLDGDGRADAIASLDVRQASGSGDGLLLAFDHTGRMLWRQRVDDRLTFGAETFSGPWEPDDVLAFQAGAEPLVAWTLHHHTWWPSLLAVFDRSGTRLGTFVNAGWIRTVQATLDGRHLIAGGVSNARDGAAFVVLGARNPNGSSPEEPGSPFRCNDCPAGTPLKYLVVPWTDVAVASLAEGRDMTVLVYPDGSSALRAVQRHSVELIVELSPAFKPVRCSVSDSFLPMHERLEREGLLDHGHARCPHRAGSLVREWTREAGWRTACPTSP